jgi:hypothetical protein
MLLAKSRVLLFDGCECCECCKCVMEMLLSTGSCDSCEAGTDSSPVVVSHPELGGVRGPGLELDASCRITVSVETLKELLKGISEVCNG